MLPIVLWVKSAKSNCASKEALVTAGAADHLRPGYCCRHQGIEVSSHSALKDYDVLKQGGGCGCGW
ncbi:hypothetical protein BAUCODRAFT_342543 [Baudoinia panamericana UAMH 10762]|uniref:Uncharacterized protein n=1 Tax=Baudoinia panamericana (strain UAMH 10762) TaxID=717646 RepID=M2N6B3_BAUPA|nr:uncharacterized protein BAUCODRAFT_342543 [Baudoinia panamericana UAMH 10762]EMC99598.1 hypothetical protein BAUCODRAFT_342543 [Baudoinia panamericana UAMH 10762]